VVVVTESIEERNSRYRSRLGRREQPHDARLGHPNGGRRGDEPHNADSEVRAATEGLRHAMARGARRAWGRRPSSLDLGIDWGAVDRVIQKSARPRARSRAGCSAIGPPRNHLLDETQRALLAPATARVS